MQKRFRAFDGINTPRLALLRALRNRELDVSELRAVLGWSRSSLYYHLGILSKAGLIEKKIERKRTFWIGAKKKHKEITRFSLANWGREALAYYEEVV